jgi:acetate---CoA ligase (ADP-forming) subunit beta
VIADDVLAYGAMPVLSEAASKDLLRTTGIPFPPERQVATADAAVAAAEALGYPVVIKLGGAGIAHKTERGLVRLDLATAETVSEAAGALLDAATPDDGDVHLLVAPMLRATREFMAGLLHDDQFGMTVMLGVGGILAEAIGDVTFRLAPLTAIDAEEMIDDLTTQRLLGPFRGEPAVDRPGLVDLLVGLSQTAAQHPEVVSADLNPVLIVDGRPVAVDALVEVAR